MIVAHRHRPELGTGLVLDAFAGTPPVYRVRWRALAPNGQRLWGDYRAVDLVAAGRPTEAA